MGKPYQAFSNTTGVLACPLCQERLVLDAASLRCSSGHCFDIAKAGSVNFVPHIKPSKDYDRENFAERRKVLEAGLYAHIRNAVSARLPKSGVLVDVGCGEGYYSRAFARQMDVYAFDLSKDSIRLAAKEDREHQVRWLVADLARLPFSDNSVDVLLDIYSPANYEEFKRVLKPDGKIIKLVPNAQHAKELRTLVAHQLDKSTYSNDRLISLFRENFELVEQVDVTETYELAEDAKKAFLSMTPLLFHVDRSELDTHSLTELTISGTMMVGKLR